MHILPASFLAKSHTILVEQKIDDISELETKASFMQSLSQLYSQAIL